MKNSKLKRIAELLTKDDDLQDEGKDDVQFCVTDELAPTDINIEVDEVGLMTFPFSRESIQKLINISSKAQFGLRDKTILDENIRNSYEIKSDKLHITINEHSLTAILSKMRNSLGLSEDSSLTAHLHNLLIYGPGMFFDMHQDTEKLENMVGSLVIVLPSPHIGGDLIIEHGTKRHVFSSENIDENNAKCISFYSDCHHKVEKIKVGYRIALTYNLVLESDDFCNIENFSENKQLTDAIRDYFDIKVDKPPQEQQRQNKERQKLVYFLDHSYTEHGLRWSMLKGTDRANVSALFKIARKLNLIPHLALVEVKKIYATDGNPYDDDASIIEHINDNVTLSYWIDSTNKKLPFSKLYVDEAEICWTTKTDSFEPYHEEYEGYQGNYGGDKEYWYRRAAIVLWPESSKIAMNFQLNFHNALNELYELTSSPGNEKEVTEIIAKAGKYLYETLDKTDKNDFERLANIALYINDKNIALSMLSHFKWEVLNSDIVKSFVKLQIQYGIDWCIILLNSWKKQGIYSSSDYYIKEILSFVENFFKYGGAASIIELLMDIQSNTLINSRHMKELFCETLQACVASNNISVLNKLIEHLISNAKLYPITNLAELFFKLQDLVPAEHFSNFKSLRSYLVKTINSDLASKMRSKDDWSIDAKFHCQCEHCIVVMKFLHSKTEKIKRLPVAKHIRAHLYSTFSCLNLPVDVSTERTGSPYKFIMEKKELLYQREKKRFDDLKLYQEKLQSDELREEKRIKLM